ncbi:MAG TPA: ferritin family protein, partial [Tissierellaceae bacterium]|nr:ferritin family protein [Tissierellaceae bacterium]
MKFDGAQILSTFVKMEEEVSQYYSALAENAGDEKSRKLFERLALEEDRHQKMYKKLLEVHSKDLVREFSEEEIEYTNSLIEENIKEKQKFDESMKLKDALDLAEQMEKDGILFVYQMMQLYPDIAQKEMKAILRE